MQFFDFFTFSKDARQWKGYTFSFNRYIQKVLFYMHIISNFSQNRTKTDQVFSKEFFSYAIQYDYFIQISTATLSTDPYMVIISHRFIYLLGFFAVDFTCKNSAIALTIGKCLL